MTEPVKKPPAKPRAKPGPKALEGTVVERDDKGRITGWRLLSDDIRAKLVEALLVGAYAEDAITYAGVSRASFYNWMNTGREVRERILIDADYTPVGHEEACLELLDAVEQAQAQSKVAAIGVIRKAARDGNWQAAAWYLERTEPRKWGRFRGDEQPAASGGEHGVIVSLEDLEDKMRKVIAQREQQSR